MDAQEDNEAGLRVPLEGKIGLRDARRTLELLEQAINAFPSVEVDLSAVTEADVCAVQLLISARKSAASVGRRLTLVVPADGAVQSVVVRAGLLGANGRARGAAEEFWCGRSASKAQGAT